MAKPYRDAPLIQPDEGVGLPILKSRTRKAAELLGNMVARFDEDLIMMVATEVGLEECLYYPDHENALSFDLTGLQLVALSSALASVAEMRDGNKKRNA